MKRKWNEFIRSLTNKVEAFWIGGKRDCHKCDTWHWNDGGEVINYTKWNSREPNNLGDREDCIEVRTDSAGWTPNRRVTGWMEHGMIDPAMIPPVITMDLFVRLNKLFVTKINFC